MNRKSHLYVTVFDSKRTVGGHLKEGYELNILEEFTIRKVDDLPFDRQRDE